MNKRWQTVAARFALLYGAGGALWIAGSDLLTGWLSKSTADYALVSMVKGFGFVLVTTLLLFITLRRVLLTEFEARAQAEETTHRLRELEAIAEHGGELFYKHDLQDRFAYVSRQYQTLLGYRPEDLTKEWTQILTDHPLNQIARERTAEAIRTGLKQPPHRVEVRKKDGSPILLEVDESPLKDSDGNVVAMVGAARDVTQRERVAEALRESEEKWRALYTSMNEGLALHELVFNGDGRAVDYRILEANPAFETITGLARASVVGKLASEVYGTGEPPYLEVYEPVAASGGPVTFETYFAPIGKHFAVSVFSPAKGQFATVFADITKRKSAESQISLLSQVYALISNISQAIVRIGDREKLFQEACRIAVDYGHLRLAWIGTVDREAREIRPTAWAGQEEGYLSHLRANGALALDGRGPAPTAAREGRVVVSTDIEKAAWPAPWREAALERGYRASIALPLTTEGQVAGVFCVYATQPGYFGAIVSESLFEVAADLSFALDLFERNRQREAEQQRLRLQHSALEAAANAIVITNRAGNIEWVNAAFTRLTGYDRQEVTGRNPRVLKSGEHDQEFYRRLWQTVRAGSVWQGALTNKRKNGTLYQEEMTITPVRSDAGEITHFVAIKQDVTERRKLEHQFLRAQRMQSIGLLAGGVAHDLNNVLAPVLMALPLLRENLPGDQRDQILETLEQSVQRGANIVQQVLTYARGVDVQRVQLQLRHLVREVARIAEETFPRDIRISSSMPPGLWPLEGDPTQIHQVLLNLAVNARDAMPEGGELIFSGRNVELTERLQFLDFEIPPGRYVSATVTDTGAGIAPEVLERMFEPFFTTKPTGKGTGLGLSTVLGIVKSHGGLVEVETKPGAGSKFTVLLPAAAAEAPAAPIPQSPSLPQGQGETILVVDDEAGILHLTKATLLANGYQVVTARHGAEGIEKFSEHAPSIRTVVTDIMMPVMDGLAMTRALRNLDSRVPVIASTGLMNPPGEEDRAGKLRDLGVRHFLRKPFQAEELLMMLHETLRG